MTTQLVARRIGGLAGPVVLAVVGIAYASPPESRPVPPRADAVNMAPPVGEPEHGMEILSVVGDRRRIRITTTGGIYDLTRKEMTLIRRIDPAINAVNPRPVAKMVFGADIGPLSVGSASKRRCVVEGQLLSFDFRSDCLVLVTCLAEPVTYTYESLITDAPWAKGRGSERIWTDGYGGSLHAANPDHPGLRVVEGSPDVIKVTLKPGTGAAMAVFPPRKFDYEALYGREARPHVWWAGNTDLGLTETAARLDELARRRFGVIMLYAGHYDGELSREVTHDELPVFDGGRCVYRFRDPARIRAFVKGAHAGGFKVIAYLAAGKFAWKQDKEVTLQFMGEFQKAYELDGWFFDNARGGRNWLASYDFVRRVRADVGPEGVLYHHNSVDVWGRMSRDGRLVPLDAYMDYTLAGETGPLADQVHGPNDPYLRYCVSGYGMSQALGTHKIATSGKAAITRAESYRVRAENLLGGGRCAHWTYDEWQRSYKPGYEARRQAYLAGRLKPDVDWPAPWFADVHNLRAVGTGPTTAEITWQTPVPADTEVRYAKRKGGGLSGVRDTSRRKADALAIKSHRVRLRALEPGTEYQFAVRSRVRRRHGQERVWGGVGTFSTAPR